MVRKGCTTAELHCGATSSLGTVFCVTTVQAASQGEVLRKQRRSHERLLALPPLAAGFGRQGGGPQTAGLSGCCRQSSWYLLGQASCGHRSLHTTRVTRGLLLSQAGMVLWWFT